MGERHFHIMRHSGISSEEDYQEFINEADLCCLRATEDMLLCHMENWDDDKQEEWLFDKETIMMGFGK